jgi:exopolyphosphatase/guanosine-5'-triphosphate,3'-diphosphate pyrophosphatase
MRVAVIDLGTNTCNLLVAEIKNRAFTILHQSKQLVQLGDDRIQKNEISSEATNRVLECLRVFKKIVTELHAEKVRIVATSGIRDAKNKIELLENISSQTGWVIKIVTGENEAQLIFEGVLLAFEKLEDPTVVLDIGGGSNEIIMAQKNHLIWKESQPTGMARVINQFSLSNPLKPEELETLENYFTLQHAAAIENCKKRGVQSLIGCSGAFDTIADLIDQVPPGKKIRKQQEISLPDFNQVYEKLIPSTREERVKMKGMDSVRIDLIIPAMILIRQLISAIEIRRIIQTDYALREGVLYELMNTPKPL